jgi:hypothetical protein
MQTRRRSTPRRTLKRGAGSDSSDEFGNDFLNKPTAQPKESEEDPRLDARIDTHFKTFQASLSYLPPHLIPSEFLPLVRRLSNVVFMVLVQGTFHRRERNILFIGETHSNHYHRKKNFVPMSELIIPYLTQAHYIDFMLETSAVRTDLRNSMYDSDDVDELRRLIQFPKNKTNLSILTQLEILVAPYITTAKSVARKKFKAARAHYIDIDFAEGHKKYSPLVHLLTSFVDCRSEVGAGSTRCAQYVDAIEDEVISSSEQGIGSAPVTKSIIEGAFAASKPMKTRIESMRRIFEIVFIVIQETLLNKCIRHNRSKTTQVYSDLFFELCETYDFSKEEFFFLLHRFIMDVVTCCRLLKSDKNKQWYKNMVVYTGASHTLNCVNLLQMYGFKAHLIDFDAQKGPSELSDGEPELMNW